MPRVLHIARANLYGGIERIRTTLAARTAPAPMTSASPTSGARGLGVAWMEGGQAALPIVTMRRRSTPELAVEDAGVLGSPGDVAALADAHARPVADAELRRRLGVRAQRRAQERCEPARRIPELVASLAPGRDTRTAAMSTIVPAR